MGGQPDEDLPFVPPSGIKAYPRSDFLADTDLTGSGGFPILKGGGVRRVPKKRPEVGSRT
jgi:hypothetical protein